jgi:hypothetical protein
MPTKNIWDLLIWVKRSRSTLVQASECASLDSDKKYEMTCECGINVRKKLLLF